MKYLKPINEWFGGTGDVESRPEPTEEDIRTVDSVLSKIEDNFNKIEVITINTSPKSEKVGGHHRIIPSNMFPSKIKLGGYTIYRQYNSVRPFNINNTNLNPTKDQLDKLDDILDRLSKKDNVSDFLNH